MNVPVVVMTKFCVAVLDVGTVTLDTFPVVAVLVAAGLGFYIAAKHMVLMQMPDVYNYAGIGVGFNIGYGLMICAFASSVISLLPFNFNLRFELDKMHIHIPRKGTNLRKE